MLVAYLGIYPTLHIYILLGNREVFLSLKELCLIRLMFHAFFFMHQRNRFFRGTLANFCKSKKCIIFNVDYCPGSKKSHFDMTTLIATIHLRGTKFFLPSLFYSFYRIALNNRCLKCVPIYANI